MTIETENSYAQYLIGDCGENLSFMDKRTGKNYCTPGSLMARIRKAGLEYTVSAASFTNGRITLQFGGSGVSAEIMITAREHYFIVEVLSISDQTVEEFTFIDIPLTLDDSVDESFTGCALALNLQTNVIELPGANQRMVCDKYGHPAGQRLRAMCYPRFGFVGARAAIIGCLQGELRKVIQEAVSNAPDLPHSSKGGPWALDDPTNRGSYILGEVTEETVDNWINLLKAVGFNQFDFTGDKSFRFGDCRLNPEMYPHGRTGLKKVIDKFHAEGIMVGLHTYSFFIDKECPWVTPVPDSRLGKDAVFTLSEPIDAEISDIPVLETTKDMSAVTGFSTRNSVTLQIEDELIIYSGVKKETPYAFTKCQRGALGTKASPHDKDAKVYHLKECWGLFTPDGDSSLLAEVAAANADMFNECGFDMIYLDALDGSDVLGGRENSWYYGSKFVFELWKRLKKPALMEMSTFHHHLWFVRSRHGAWDTPSRSQKHFIDIHTAANEDCRRIFLPAHLGWWTIKKWIGIQQESTFTDDIEYLCGKCLGTDSGFSLSGKPDSLENDSVMRRMAGIIKQYETLRREGYFPESIKAKLRLPGAEFKLLQTSDKKWQFRSVQYTKHKVEVLDGQSNIWQVKNGFGRQPLKLRIEALMSVSPYDAADNITLADFSDPAEFSDCETAEGIVADLRSSTEKIKAGQVSGCYSAWRTGEQPAETECSRGFSMVEHGKIIYGDKVPSWTKMSKKFSPVLDLGQDVNVGGEHQGLGVWFTVTDRVNF